MTAVMTPADDRQLLSARQVAKQLQVSERTARWLMAEGKLRTVRVGRQLRTRQSWLDSFVDRQGRKG